MNTIVDLPPRPISPEVTVRTDVDSLFKTFTNRRGETLRDINPNATVSIETIANPAEQVKFSSQYIYEPNLDFLENGLIPYYNQGYGIDIFNMKGVTTVTDPYTGEVTKISPPVAFINEFGQIQLIDGAHRVYYAATHNLPINIMIIDGIPPEYICQSYPTGIEEVKVYDKFPKIKRTHPRPNVDRSKIIDFSPLGSKAERVGILEKEAPFFPETPHPEKEDLVKQFNQAFQQAGASGLLPSAINPESLFDKESRVLQVENVTPIDNDYFLAEFNLSWKGNESQPPSKYSLIAETKKRSKESANLVVISSEKISSSILPENEVSISKDLRQQINQELIRNLFPPIVATEDNPSISTDAPRVTDFELISTNPRYSILVVEAGDQKISYIINHPETFQNEPINGSTFVLRDQQNNLMMINRYREAFGMSDLEFSRMFAFDLKRLQSETGVDFRTEVTLEHLTTIPEARQFELNNLSILSGTLNDGYLPNTPDYRLGGDAKELSTLVSISDEEIHQLISKGNLHCDFTNSTITVDQLNRHIIKLNLSKDPDQHYVVLEKSASPIEGKYFYHPPRVKTGAGTRLGQNSFPNNGCALIYEHTEIGGAESLPSGKCYQSFSITKIVDMISSGQLDTVTISQLSNVLRSQGYLVMA